ncbi:MAG: RHS domain-containing protein, partial [Proteus hauseri]|nr:RHS domain-containing protein [Proteus hauseri]
LYHCDHRGLPLALISLDGAISWRAEYDEWGNVQREDNPHNLQQLIRLPGQQYDDESGLHYNRHRYYNPGLGRYTTQDPIGLEGGWNPYAYPLNPITEIDPQGLNPLILGVAALMSCGLLSSAGVIQSGQQHRDQYGRKVNPEADKLTNEHKSGLNPGGNCTPQDLSDLQNEKNRLCNQSRACAPQMPRNEILRRYEVNLACASVRKQINNQCFGGGDKAHMEEENKAYKTAADCSGLIK